MRPDLVPRVVTVVAVLALVCSACGDADDADDAESSDGSVESSSVPIDDEQSDDDGAATSVAPNGEEIEVLALDNNFRDEEVEIVAGTTVTWENRGRNDHNIIPVEDSEDWGAAVEDFAPGDVYSHAFTTPGEYGYYCTLHGTADFGMIGTVVVTG